MRTTKVMRIAGYTLKDQLYQRSFFVLLAVCMGLIMLIRGCYSGNYTVNGQQLNPLEVAWNASIAAYHVIAVLGMLIAILLAGRLLRHNEADGTAIFLLSKPVARWEYVLGGSLGVWTLAAIFTLALHTTVFVMTLTITGGALPGLLAASVVSCVNELFVVAAVSLCALVFPEIIALLISLGIIGFSFIIAAMHGVQSFLASSHMVVLAKTPLWQIAWPAVSGVQLFGQTLISGKEFSKIGPLHPLVNVGLYTVLAGALLVWRFSREEL